MIYFCVPCHDEAVTVGLVLWKIRKVLEELPHEYQMLVGDDASTDGTAEVLTQYAKVLPLTVIRSERRLGYAATVELLLREALRRSDRHKRDAAVLLQADFTTDPGDLPEFLKRLDSGADVIVGEATLEREPDRWRRMVRRWAPTLLGSKAQVPGIRDVVSGFVAFRLISLRNAFRDRQGSWLTVEGWAANAELLAWAAAGARRVEPVAIPERIDRRQRASRHGPWMRARQLWAARRKFVTPAIPPRVAAGSPSKEAA